MENDSALEYLSFGIQHEHWRVTGSSLPIQGFKILNVNRYLMHIESQRDQC